MLQYSGDTEYITRLNDESEMVKKRLLSREKVLGFGCEWRGDNKIGVISIATPCAVYIFHVAAYKERMDSDSDTDSSSDSNSEMDSNNETKKRKKKLFLHKKKTIPPFLLVGEAMFNLSTQNNADDISHELRYLLESNNYLKVGVNITADFMKLSQDYDVQWDPNSILDLGDFYNLKKDVNNDWNVCSLCSLLFEGEIDRNRDIAKSEWNKYPLDDEQMRYCSETAYFSLKLFFKINQIINMNNSDNEDESDEDSDIIDIDTKYNGIHEYEYEYEEGYDNDIEYDHDFENKLTEGTLCELQQNIIAQNNEKNESASPENDDYFANICCDEWPLQSNDFMSMSPVNALMNTSNSSLTQMQISTHNEPSLKPLNLINMIEEEIKSENEAIEVVERVRIEIEGNLAIKIRKHEIENLKKMDVILSSYWMWSYHDLIFPNRKRTDFKHKYMVYGTGNVNTNRNALSLKKYDIYTCFHTFNMSFDTIIAFRAYSLSYKQIEMALSDCINLGYEYNWKWINNSIFKTSKYCKSELNECESQLNANSFYIDFILLQIKVIELLQKQLNQIFIKYPELKAKLLTCYNEEGINPNKLQKLKKNLVNNKQNFVSIIPDNYEQKLKKVRVIFEDIWMFVKLKPLRVELIRFFLKQEEMHQNNNQAKHLEKGDMKIDLLLIRYSLIRMIVFHIKRVVWMKHFIFH